MPSFPHEIVPSQRSRQSDRHGSGQYAASRGGRRHQGVDIVVYTGQKIHSPIEGEVIREALPYADDLSYRGLVIRGSGDWSGYEVKIFYVEGLATGPVSPGTVIGYAQDLSRKYPGITNHVHVEVRRFGSVLPLTDLYRMCF